MPTRLRLIALCAVFALSLTLAACGGADSGTPAQAAQAEPVILASFGTNGPCSFGLAGGTSPIHIYNYSDSLISEAGIRPVPTAQNPSPVWTLLTAADPVTFGNVINGGSFLASMPVGQYEIFLETDEGRLEFTGYVPCVELPFDSEPVKEFQRSPAGNILFGKDGRPLPVLPTQENPGPEFTRRPPLEYRAGEADIYLFSYNVESPNPGGGNPTPPITPPIIPGGGPTPGGGGSGILP